MFRAASRCGQFSVNLASRALCLARKGAWPGAWGLGYRPVMPGIVIAGAGFGGIGTGIALTRAGFRARTRRARRADGTVTGS